MLVQFGEKEKLKNCKIKDQTHYTTLNFEVMLNAVNCFKFIK